MFTCGPEKKGELTGGTYKWIRLSGCFFKNNGNFKKPVNQ